MASILLLLGGCEYATSFYCVGATSLHICNTLARLVARLLGWQGCNTLRRKWLNMQRVYGTPDADYLTDLTDCVCVTGQSENWGWRDEKHGDRYRQRVEFAERMQHPGIRDCYHSCLYVLWYSVTLTLKREHSGRRAPEENTTDKANHQVKGESIMRKRAKGFTLVEIMIVVAIIGLLVAIALPNFMEARKKSQIKTAKASMQQIEGANEQYKLDGATNDITALADLTPTYIKAVPVCPVGDWLTQFSNPTNIVSCLIDGVTYTAYSNP